MLFGITLPIKNHYCMKNVTLVLIATLLTVFTPCVNITATNNLDTSDDCKINIAFEYDVQDLRVQFTNAITGMFDSLTWDFGDNTAISTEDNPTHAYKDEGTYTFCVTAKNTSNGCEERFCGEVHVFK